MSYTTEISNAIAKISKIENDMRNEERKVTSEVESSKNWWTGNANKSFTTKYREDGALLNMVHDDISDLNKALRKLISVVDSVDTERRIQAEKLREEQEKNKKAAKK